MQEVFGNYIEPDGNNQEYLIIHFSPTSIPLQQRWRNNGLSASFLADYWVTFFPAQDEADLDRQREIEGVINYIANELLENTMKFSYQPADHSVSLALYLYQNEFRFYASNALDPETIEPFQARIQRLLDHDPQELYLEQLKANAAQQDYSNSQLGLLTMLHDYGARLAWKFSDLPDRSGGIVVTTMVQWRL